MCPNGLQLGISFGHGLTPTQVVEGSREADKAGLKVIFVSESVGFDALVLLGSIADQTNNVRIGSGIVNIYSRSPVQLAMAAATIDELSHGRFILGIGVSSKEVVTRWHGIEFSQQLERAIKSIDIIKSKLDEIRNKSVASSNAKIPIILAAVGPKMTRIAKDKTDGVLFFLRPFSSLRKETGLSSNNFAVHASIVTCVSHNNRSAEQRARKTIAFYIVNGTAYRNYLERYPDLLPYETAETVRAEWQKGRRDEAARLIPQALLDELAIYGTVSECRKRIENHYSNLGLDTLLMQFNQGEVPFSESLQLILLLAKE